MFFLFWWLVCIFLNFLFLNFLFLDNFWIFRFFAANLFFFKIDVFNYLLKSDFNYNNFLSKKKNYFFLKYINIFFINSICRFDFKQNDKNFDFFFFKLFFKNMYFFFLDFFYSKKKVFFFDYNFGYFFIFYFLFYNLNSYNFINFFSKNKFFDLRRNWLFLVDDFCINNNVLLTVVFDYNFFIKNYNNLLELNYPLISAVPLKFKNNINFADFCIYYNINDLILINLFFSVILNSSFFFSLNTLFNWYKFLFFYKFYKFITNF